MADRAVALCNFCEIHGPRIVFACMNSVGHQHQHLSEGRSIFGDWRSDFSFGSRTTGAAAEDEDDSFRCDGCRSLINRRPAFITNDHKLRVSYVGCQAPGRAELYSLLRGSCIRSLSCEVSPGGQGWIFFGDAGSGYCLCYSFTLKDAKARGFRRSYSLVTVSRLAGELLKNLISLMDGMKLIVDRLQDWSEKVFAKEGAQSSDRMPQIAASGRAGLMPSGFFLRQPNVGAGGRSVSSPRSLIQLTDRPDLFRRLHEMFVNIHRKIDVLEMWKWDLLVDRRLSADSDTDSSTEAGTTDAVEHSCSLCGDGFRSPPAFQSLTMLYASLGSEAFSLLAYHLLIGNQIVVRSSCVKATAALLEALKLLLPSGCVRSVDISSEYRRSYECNLLGLIGDFSSNSIDQYSTVSEEECIILCAEPSELAGGGWRNVRAEGGVPRTNGGGISDLSKICRLRLFCAAASTNACLETSRPQMLDSLLILLSSVISRTCRFENKADASLVLETLKDEWLRKAKLYYAMSKSGGRQEQQIRTDWKWLFFRVAKCRPVDEPLLKFWLSGVCRQYKRSVLSQCALVANGDSSLPKEKHTQNGHHASYDGVFAH